LDSFWLFPTAFSTADSHSLCFWWSIWAHSLVWNYCLYCCF